MPLPRWFDGPCLELWFGDVTSERDAHMCRSRAASIDDIRVGLEFFREAMRRDDSRLLVYCEYGASRSPAIAYVFIADLLGPGREEEAFALMLDVRPVAAPNGLVVRLGDELLGRNGAMIQPFKQLRSKLPPDSPG